MLLFIKQKTEMYLDISGTVGPRHNTWSWKTSLKASINPAFWTWKWGPGCTGILPPKQREKVKGKNLKDPQVLNLVSDFAVPKDSVPVREASKLLTNMLAEMLTKANWKHYCKNSLHAEVAWGLKLFVMWWKMSLKSDKLWLICLNIGFTPRPC